MRVFGEDILYSSKYGKVGVEPALPVAEWSWQPFDREACANMAAVPDWRALREAVETNYVPSGRRQDVVLVFPIGHGLKSLFETFDEKGTKYFYLDFDDVASRCELRVSVGGSPRAELEIEGVRLDLADVAAVLWHPPEHMRRLRPNARGARLYMQRWVQFLKDLRGLVRDDAIWLPSHPLNGSFEWQNKFSEYELASREGLRVPETLFTTDADAALAFVRAHGGRVIFREMHPDTPDSALRFIGEKEIERGRAKIRMSPITLQAYVPKAFEVRAVLVGDRIFACKIDSQASAVAATDWRAYDNKNVKWEPMRLPKRVEAALLRFAERVDLKHASFDLICTPEGEWVFLEANRPGASHWLKFFAGLDVGRELALYLDRHIRRTKRGRRASLR